MPGARQERKLLISLTFAVNSPGLAFELRNSTESDPRRQPLAGANCRSEHASGMLPVFPLVVGAMTDSRSTRKLDRLDLKILRALQENARISYVDLADKVGLSTTPCMDRVKRLESAGVIQGYHASLDPIALGLTLLVFVEITLSNQSPEAFDAFREAVDELSYVQECHLVSGQSDYLIKLRLTDLASYRKYLGELLLALPHVRESKSYIVMEEAKQTALLPLDLISHRFKR